MHKSTVRNAANGLIKAAEQLCRREESDDLHLIDDLRRVLKTPPAELPAFALEVCEYSKRLSMANPLAYGHSELDTLDEQVKIFEKVMSSK